MKEKLDIDKAITEEIEDDKKEMAYIKKHFWGEFEDDGGDSEERFESQYRDIDD